MARKILVICGQTATGKTSLGIALSKKLNGEIVSADSRQVYKGMDIGTGKDLPEKLKIGELQKGDFQKVENNRGKKLDNLKKEKIFWRHYEIDGVKVWGYDLMEPWENFSVSLYADFAFEIIDNIWDRGKLPIIVGGSGLYIKALLDGIDTLKILPDFNLRKKLVNNPPTKLYELLIKLDRRKALSMNQSDKNNPRRLIRAIEIASFLQGKKDRLRIKKKFLPYDFLLMIGLMASKDKLEENIRKRVEQRIKTGFQKEVLEIIRNKVDWSSQSMQSMGYKQYKDYFEGRITFEEFKNRWIRAELYYAKRQLVWFKKDPRINWFNISCRGWKKDVEKLVVNWYYKN